MEIEILKTNELITNEYVANVVSGEDLTTSSVITTNSLNSNTNTIQNFTCPNSTFNNIIAQNFTSTDMSAQTLESTTINVAVFNADNLTTEDFNGGQASCRELNTVSFNCNQVNSQYYETDNFTTLDLEVIQDTAEASVPTRVASTIKNGTLTSITEYKVINNTPSLFSDLQLATDAAGTNTLFIYGDVVAPTISLPRIIGYNTTIGTYDNETLFGGQIAYLSLCSNTGSPRTLRYERNGKLSIYSDTNTIVWQSTNMVSDNRSKTDVRPIYECFDKLASLNGYYYNYTYEPGTRQAGLLAQDVVGVFPEAIIRPNDSPDAMMSLDYKQLIPVMIESLKEIEKEFLLCTINEPVSRYSQVKQDVL